MAEAEITQFKGYFSAWTVIPCSLNIAYLARFVDNTWVLWNCRLTFGSRIWQKEEEWEINTPDIRAGNIRLNIQSNESADLFFESAINGILPIDQLNLALPNNSDRSYYLSTTEHNPVFFSHSLRVSPRQHEQLGISHNSLFLMDEDLRCGTCPFDGVDDLFSFLGFNERTLFSNPFIELIIQPPVDLDISASDMNEGKLTLGLIKHPKFDESLISVGLRCFPNPSIDRRVVITNQETTWRNGDWFQLAEINKEFSDTVMVQVFVSVDGKIARRHVIHDRSRATNLRYHPHQHFDGNLKKLKEALIHDKNSREFEKAISIIFNVLGFTTSPFIDLEAPDLVMFSPKGRMILVECTLQTHDIRTKAGKLHHRRTEIQEKIKSNFPWVEVIAILVCNQQRMTITEDDFVSNNKIILYCQEDIQFALERLQLLSDPDAMIDSALEKLERKDKNVFGH